MSALATEGWLVSMVDIAVISCVGWDGVPGTRNQQHVRALLSSLHNAETNHDLSLAIAT